MPFVEELARFGTLLVFLNVLLEQLGLPVPAFPLFVVAGALAAGGRLSFPLVVLAVLAAALLADSAWFVVGRRHGYHVLRFLCGLSLSADTCVKDTARAYDRWGLRSLLVAKFVPGLSAVSTPLAGAVGAPYGRFLAWDAAGTLLWALSGVGLGALFHDEVEAAFSLGRRLGAGALVLLVAALALFLAVKAFRRSRSLRSLRMARIEPSELHGRLALGEPLVVLDVRSRLSRRADPRKVPGALVADLGELDEKLRELPRAGDVALYCT